MCNCNQQFGTLGHWKQWVCQSNRSCEFKPPDDDKCQIQRQVPVYPIQCDNPRRYYDPRKWDSTVVRTPIDVDGALVTPRSEYQTFIQSISPMIYGPKGCD